MTEAKWSPEMKSDFTLKQFKVLSAMLPDKFLPPVPIEEAELTQKSLNKEWLEAGAAKQFFKEVSDALVSFQRYIATNYIKTSQSEEEYLEINVQYDYGTPGGIVTWKLGSHFRVSSPNDRLSAQNSLFQAIYALKSDWERTSMQRPQNAPSEPRKEADTVLTRACTKLVIDMKDGKKSFKIKGGEWEKFGVRVFPEVLKAAKIKPDEIPLEGMDMEGWDMFILMKPDGNPDKVTMLAHG